MTKSDDQLGYSKPSAGSRRASGALAARFLLIAVCVAFFAVAPALAPAQLKLPGQPQSPAPAPTTPAPAAAAPTPAPPQAIPLPQIADQAEALDAKLEEISRGLTTQADETKPNPTISGQSSEIAERAHQVDSFLESGPDIMQLREEIVYWRALSRLSADQRKLLTDRADQLQNQITLLDPGTSDLAGDPGLDPRHRRNRGRRRPRPA